MLSITHLGRNYECIAGIPFKWPSHLEIPGNPKGETVMSFEFEGLDDLINRLNTIEKKVPEGINKLKLVVTKDILDDVIENTPANKDPRALTRGNLRVVGRSEI